MSKRYINYATGKVENMSANEGRSKKTESKIKKFVKDNKKIIITGIVATATTAFVYHKFGRKALIDVDPYLRFDLTLSPKMRHENEPIRYGHLYGSITPKELTLKDCGRLGESIRDLTGVLGDDTIVKNIGITYDIVNKEVAQKS
jgi:hypothetical protein